MLDVDPEPVKPPGHTQILNDVVVEHPPHREHHEPLASLETLLDEIAYVTSPREASITAPT